MAKDFTRLQATVFTISSQFAHDSATLNTKTKYSKEWFKNFEVDLAVFYTDLKKIAEEHYLCE